MSQIHYTKDEILDYLRNGAVLRSTRSGQSIWWSLDFPDGSYQNLPEDCPMGKVVEDVRVEKFPTVDATRYSGNWRWKN